MKEAKSAQKKAGEIEGEPIMARSKQRVTAKDMEKASLVRRSLLRNRVDLFMVSLPCLFFLRSVTAPGKRRLLLWFRRRSLLFVLLFRRWSLLVGLLGGRLGRLFYSRLFVGLFLCFHLGFGVSGL